MMKNQNQDLRELTPAPTMTNADMITVIARLVQGDLVDALDAILALLNESGWEWRKPEGYFGAVVDNHGEYHLLHYSQSWPDAVANAYRLHQQYRAMGWL